MNKNLILVAGKSASGKSLSLRNLRNPEGVWYLDCENNKGLPFNSKFQEFIITDPRDVYGAFTEAEKHEDVHTIIIDTATYLMDLYESQYVLTAANTMKAWGEYAQFFKRLMAEYVAKSTKDVIILAHTMDVLNESEMINETLVKVKGSLMNQGIESYFTTVVATKKLATKKLDGYASDLLNITDEEKIDKFKYVYQTKLTEETVNERIRSKYGMWSRNETYIDNDIQLVIDRIHAYHT